MVGSRMSGSSARPMRSVVSANALAWNVSNKAAAAAKRRIFIAPIPSQMPLHRRWCTGYTNTAARRSFLRKAEGRDQFLQRGREGAVGGNDAVGGRQFRSAVTGRGMACALSDQLRHLAAAAIHHKG